MVVRTVIDHFVDLVKRPEGIQHDHSPNQGLQPRLGSGVQVVIMYRQQT